MFDWIPLNLLYSVSWKRVQLDLDISPKLNLKMNNKIKI